MLIVTVIFVVPLLLYIGFLNNQYKKGSYYKLTKRSYLSVLNNTGHRGEFWVYNNLKSLEKQGARFLFNAYIPKSNGGTTEIDVLMICSKGIVVFESKNYKGWIFGDEMQEKWCQVLKSSNGSSRKEFFYNPIKQNRSHIKHLKNFFEKETFVNETIPFHSIIVFSNECTFKNINIHNYDVSLIHRNRLDVAIKNIYDMSYDVSLDATQINKIYEKLYPYTQVSEDVKAKHRENIKNSFS